MKQNKSIQNWLSSLHPTYVTQTALPAPYDDLLRQPLLTGALRQYYQRTLIIHIIDAHFDIKNNIYTRVINTLIDKDKTRDNPMLAHAQKEALITEIAHIMINFDALPEAIIHDILNTNIPFGQLIIDSGIAIHTKNRQYFSVKCEQTLQHYTRCTLGSMLYGRKNTIICSDNNEWLADVVEVLTLCNG